MLRGTIVAAAVAAGMALALAPADGRALDAAMPGRDAPRIEGSWRVTFRPQQRGSGLRAYSARWRMRPECATGACAVMVSVPGERFRLVPDAGLIYRPATLDRIPAACGKVRNAYVAVARHAFKVVDSEPGEDGEGELAVRIVSRSTVTYTPTRAGRKAGCGPAQLVWRATGVRVAG